LGALVALQLNPLQDAIAGIPYAYAADLTVRKWLSVAFGPWLSGPWPSVRKWLSLASWPLAFCQKMGVLGFGRMANN